MVRESLSEKLRPGGTKISDPVKPHTRRYAPTVIETHP